MRDYINIVEEMSPRLADYVTAKVDFADADFWIERRGSEKTVGEPKRDFAKERIGIKVTHTDALDPHYLFYVMQHLFQRGYWKTRATGTTNLVNIKINDILSITIG